MLIRSSTAEWAGDLKGGKGTMTVGKGAYTGPFSFASRFEEGTGTNPEELIAAAHAGCFSMALSGGLAKEGFAPKKVSTRGNVHIGPDPAGGFRISLVELIVDAEVPGIDKAKFDTIVEGTRTGCPISKLLKNGTEITVKASLKG
jgi:osmotically inducible protein OsmC